MTTWTAIERPGYLGRHRNERYAAYDEQYGADNWRLRWAGGYVTGGISTAVMWYEDAYMNFFSSHAAIVRQLVAEASNVYDDAPSNTASGVNYAAQETGRTHLQDIAIRRCLLRLGVWFTGDDLIQIRDSAGTHSLSLTLSPGQVPFHRPNWIYQPELTGWWQSGSVESFYQSNKWLQVRS
ncbi:hypothetical protein HJC99_02115 [Candidatus Saccharibacteria bacterium]|nr:hypothetical protein [Candidatus Saccharibacteria bacterium]